MVAVPDCPVPETTTEAPDTGRELEVTMPVKVNLVSEGSERKIQFKYISCEMQVNEQTV